MNGMRVGIIVVLVVAILAAIALFGSERMPSGSMLDDVGSTGGTSTPVSPSPPTLYTGSDGAWTMRPAEGYAPDASHVYQVLGPGREIYGVRFAVPSSVATGTNLSDDSYLSVEELPQEAQMCSAKLFLGEGAVARTVTDEGVAYSVASSSDAGAGNRYDEIVYALPGTDPCLAVRYFIHFTVIDNYPMDTVREFDRAALLRQFNMMRRSLKIAQ